MLQNAYFLAKIGADTAENEQHFAEICQPTICQFVNIALAPSDPLAQDPARWRGQNLLGRALARVRAELRREALGLGPEDGEPAPEELDDEAASEEEEEEEEEEPD